MLAQESSFLKKLKTKTKNLALWSFTVKYRLGRCPDRKPVEDPIAHVFWF
jgi:hypothetical protein